MIKINTHNYGLVTIIITKEKAIPELRRSIKDARSRTRRRKEVERKTQILSPAAADGSSS